MRVFCCCFLVVGVVVCICVVLVLLFVWIGLFGGLLGLGVVCCVLVVVGCDWWCGGLGCVFVFVVC